MEFTEDEIKMLITLLEAEKKKEQHTLNFFHAEIESAYKKLTSIIAPVLKKPEKEEQSYCQRCANIVSESELIDDICLSCQTKALNT